MFGWCGVNGVRDPVLLGFAEVIDEEVAGHGGDPGHKGAALHVVGAERAVHLDEDFLGKVLGVVGGAGETVADVVDTAMVALDDLFPGDRVTGDAASDKSIDDLDVFQPALPRTPGFSAGDGGLRPGTRQG